MFWLDRIYGQIEVSLKDKIASGKTLIIRDEKTASGRVHIGSMRGVAVHGALSDLLTEKKVAHRFLYEINDFDAFDALLPYIDEETYRPYLGAPLFSLPSPEPGFKNYAEYFADEFLTVVQSIGVKPEIHYSHEQYVNGRYNEAIARAFEKRDLIREIYKRVSGSVKDASWFPVMMICEQCGKIATTRIVSFDGEQARYVCEQNKKPDAPQGCGYEGARSPFDGNAKLTWKVEWGAKFKIFSDDIEGEGKDLATKGGARDVANHIAREVLGYEPPFDIPYEFILVGGKKMSTSKGNASSSKEIGDFLPPHIFRLMLLAKDPNQQTNFDPAGDTIPILFDTYDKLAEKYWSGISDDNTRLFEYAHFPQERSMLKERRRFLPRFSQIAFLVQMPHLDIEEEVVRMKGDTLSQLDKEEIEVRARYAKHWLEKAASDEYRFVLAKESVPEGAKNFSPEQKEALADILAYIKTQTVLDGQELHTALHDIRKKRDIPAGDFFSAIYLSFLGKPSGPKAGWFLSVLDKEFVLSRLAEVSV